MADNNTNNPNEKNDVTDPSRRRFVKNTGFAVGGVAGGALLGGLFSNRSNKNNAGTTDSGKEPKKEKRYEEARIFFTRFADFAILSHAVETIFPEDDNGPGAIELGVPYFIDRQLAGPWGMNAGDYRQGSFANSNGSAADSILTRGEIFIIGLRKMEEESQKRFSKKFAEVEEEQHIEILKAFEAGEVKMNGISSDSFLSLLRSSTMEGAYSDPLYGGNRDMKGWKMKEFPGAVASYANMIEEKEFVKMDPVSLTDYQQK